MNGRAKSRRHRAAAWPTQASWLRRCWMLSA